MAIEWENGFVKRISLGGLTGADWGISVQDGGSWFTLDGAAGCTINDIECVSLPNGFRRSLELVMAEGHWMVTVDATSWRGTVTLGLRLESLGPSRFAGMAVDIQFDQASFERALVGLQAMQYGDPGLWSNGQAPGLTLAGMKGMTWIRVAKASDRLTRRIGVRAGRDRWIIHAELAAHRGSAPGTDPGVGVAEYAIVPVRAGETLELSVECELWAAKPEIPAETPAMLQLA